MRQTDHVSTYAKKYPGAWDRIADLRAAKGTRSIPDWPGYMYVPYAGIAEIMMHEAFGYRETMEHGEDLPRVAALAAWRQTQGVYRFDEAILDAVWETPLTGDLPTEILMRLPEWCVYVETPARTLADTQFYGFYAMLDSTPGYSALPGLRLLIDIDGGLFGICIELGGTFEEGLRKALTMGSRAAHWGTMSPEDQIQLMDSARRLAPLISALLYLCSETCELRDRKGSSRVPTAPREAPKRCPNAPTVWECGYRLGAALRRARAEAGEKRGGSHASPRAHVRRAHWHHFWRGPKEGERELVLRWLPPIPVNVDTADDLVPTVRRVAQEVA